MLLITPEGNPQPSRRSALASLFTAAYAPAALSACASPITTPIDEIITDEVSFPGAGGYSLPAYLARPALETRNREPRVHMPAIIVVNEIFGIHAYIKDVCHRFAREGFVALAPDYFDRAGDPALLADFAEIMPIVRTATHQQVLDDTAGALAWLKAQRFVNAEAIGVTGFCWGGTVVWMAAGLLPDVRAGVAWYGRLVASEGQEEGRPWPVDIAPNLAKPVLGLYAGEDRGIPLDSVEAMRAALASTGNRSGSEIVVYSEAQHGFHADYRASYNAEAAADGWARALTWFRANGVG